MEGAPKKGLEEKEKGEKATGQASDSESAKRKIFEGSRSRKSGRGKSSGQRPPKSTLSHLTPL